MTNLETFTVISLFFFPFSSLVVRQDFANNKFDILAKYNLTISEIAVYDSTFLLWFSVSLIVNGFISSCLMRTTYKLIHLSISIFGCLLFIVVFYEPDTDKEDSLLSWNLHAIFLAPVWPISFSLISPMIKNNFVKCMWTANGVIGQYLAYFINQLFPTYLLYVVCAFLNVVLIILYFYNDKPREEEEAEAGTLTNVIQPVLDIDNPVIVQTLTIVKLVKRPYAILTCTCLMMCPIKFISSSISNWLPSKSRDLYQLYSFTTFVGTVYVGVITYWFKCYELLFFVLLTGQIIVYQIAFSFCLFDHTVIWFFIGFAFGSVSTLQEILICEKNAVYLGKGNNIALMTSLMSFIGNVGNAIIQNYVYMDLNLYIVVFGYVLFGMAFVKYIVSRH